MKALDNLTLSNVLRHCVAGACFLAAFAVICFPSQEKIVAFLNSITATHATVAVAATFVIGTIIYGIHRAILFPPWHTLLRWFLSLDQEAKKCHFTNKWILGNDTLELDYRRVKDRQPSKDVPGETLWLASWADQIHMLFTASWSIVFAFIAAFGCKIVVIDAEADFHPLLWQLLIVAGGLFLVALFSNARYLIAEYRFLWRDPANHYRFFDVVVTEGAQQVPGKIGERDNLNRFDEATNQEGSADGASGASQ